MQTQTQEEKAINLVRSSCTEREPVDIFIRNRLEAFDGIIYFVHWKSNKDNREFNTLSFFRDGSNDPVFLWRDGDETIRYFSALTNTTNIFEKIARYIFSLSGVSSIIAFMITLTICYLVVNGKNEVPGILANALTVILGFFFGSEVTKKKD
jgi:hypothetical protein